MLHAPLPTRARTHTSHMRPAAPLSLFTRARQLADNIVQAMIGHESYGGPSTGGHFHWLHHQLINGNYGGDFVPLDYYLGTYLDGKDCFKGSE